MFERFTRQAREVVVRAQDVAAGSERIRSEHLLVALCAVPDNPARTILEARGIRRADVEGDVDRARGAADPPSAAEALATLGIDLEQVRRQIEDAFGPGALDRTRAGRGRWGRHIPFDRDAKKVLELALREALHLRHRHIGCEHLLLGMLHREVGAAGRILRGRRLELAATRSVVDELVRGRRAG